MGRSTADIKTTFRAEGLGVDGERAVREDFHRRETGANAGQGLPIQQAYREFTEMMERRMDRFTSDVAAALAGSRTTFEHGVLTIREQDGPDVVVDFNAMKTLQGAPMGGLAELLVSDAGAYGKTWFPIPFLSTGPRSTPRKGLAGPRT